MIQQETMQSLENLNRKKGEKALKKCARKHLVSNKYQRQNKGKRHENKQIGRIKEINWSYIQ